MQRFFVLGLIYILVFGAIIGFGNKLPLLFQHHGFWYFSISFLFSAVIFNIKLRQSSFYGTMKHELCHWLFSVITFRKPAAFNIHQHGGGQYAYYGKRNYLIVLSPYFFPITTFFLLALHLFFVRPSNFYFTLIGISLAFDVISMLKDYHFQQSDWKVYGLIFSMQFSILLGVFFFILHLIVLFQGYPAVWKFLKDIFLFYKRMIT